MHGAAFVGSLMQLFQGNVQRAGRRSSTPSEVWRTSSAHGINSILIVGDAMGRPLIEALDELEAAGEELDLSSFFSLSSSAAVFSPTVKDRFLERFPNLVLTDSIGATESGFNGILTVGKDDTAMKGGGPTVLAGRRHRRARRRPEARRARLRASSARWPAAATSRSATTRTRRRRPRPS